MITDKQIKAGLKKCPLHKFETLYKPERDSWYQCKKCKGFHKMDEFILKQVNPKWEVKIDNGYYKEFVSIAYEFLD